MPDGGYILLWRSFFDHELWRKDRVFSEAEAWLDCWARLAAYQPHNRHFNNSIVSLDRGQFVASDRYLMKRWGWKSMGKTRAFIAYLVSRQMIRKISSAHESTKRSTKRSTPPTLYAVVNYELYNVEIYYNGAQNGALNGAKRSKDVRTKEREVGVFTQKRTNGNGIDPFSRQPYSEYQLNAAGDCYWRNGHWVPNG